MQRTVGSSWMSSTAQSRCDTDVERDLLRDTNLSEFFRKRNETRDWESSY